MDVTIRSIAADELPDFLRALDLAFHGGGSEDDLQQERLLAEPDRYFVALEGDRIVGTAGACSTLLTVPGGRSLPAPGVTAVGVLPSHRRRGINTRLMGRLLDQAAERREPLAFLWASESFIYGRFGYGMASLSTELEIPTDRSAFLPAVRTSGRVRILPRDEALPLMRPVYDTVASRRPGMISIDDRWWTWLFHEYKRDAKEPPFFALHEGEDGIVDGYATYKVKHRWEHGVPANELRIEQLIATDPIAYAALWRYLLDVDLVALVRAGDRPADEELLRLVREPRRTSMRTFDGLWLRLIDIPAALCGRRFSADGHLVLEIDDAFRPATSGRYELVVEGGEATCALTGAEPDLACGVGALGAAYLGGSSFRQLERAHQVRELVPGALARVDATFASDPSPWYGFEF